jgi:PAS domain S-box-containing protein
MMAPMRHPDQVFHALFDASADGVLLVDPQGVILLANAAATALLGYRREALPGMSVDALVPQRFAQGHAAHRHDYAVSPRVRPMGSDIELTARRADGSEVPVEISLSPMTGELRGCVAISMRDVGAYPRVQRALRRSRYNAFVAQLGRKAVDARDPHTLLERIPALVAEALEAEAAVVFLLSPDRQTLRAASYTGIDAAQAEGLSQANHADTPCGYALAHRLPVTIDALDQERRFRVPPQMLALGAKSCLGVPLTDRGEAIGVLALWSTHARRFGADEVAFLEALSNLLSTSLQRAQIEAQLAHSQRLETVGQLTGGIAHDFNNLLTVVLGNLQLLANHAPIRSDPLAASMVRAAMRAGQRGAALTRTLLAFSRRQVLTPVAVDPAELLESLAEMLRRTLGERIQIELQIDRSCPWCLADAVQLESALLNVAVNARDAMPDGGTLWLACGGSELPATLGDGQAAQPRRAVYFRLRDSGTGMSQEVLDHAFEPFFTTKEAGHGTGLGLATVYGFVTQSGGQVQIDSAPGAGTTVTLLLPAIDSDVAETADGRLPRNGDKSVPAGLRILLVEDDDAVRAITQSFLTRLGCRVSAQSSASAALAALQGDGPFDLLLTDLSLGEGLQGDQLAHRALQLAPALKVLLVSGYAAAGGRTEETLPWPLLSKPYDRDSLAQAITQAMANTTATPR